MTIIKATGDGINTDKLMEAAALLATYNQMAVFMYHVAAHPQKTGYLVQLQMMDPARTQLHINSNALMESLEKLHNKIRSDLEELGANMMEHDDKLEEQFKQARAQQQQIQMMQ